jgi:hypothetical protein
MTRQSNYGRLTQAVEKLHGAEAQFVASSLVYERAGNKMVWSGSVSEFKLIGHPTAQSCYAWSDPPHDGHRERFYAVLRTPEIDTPDKAVRASIVADARRTNEK